jgi:hypothetical protein
VNSFFEPVLCMGLFERGVWQIWCQILNVSNTSFLVYMYMQLNLGQNIDKYDANFYVCFLVYSCNFEFKKKNWQVWFQFLNATCMCFLVLRLYAILNLRKQNWQIWCQFLNACCLHMHMCFFCTRAIFELFERKIDKYDANFWMLFSCAFYVLVHFEFIKEKNWQIWCQFLNVIFMCFFCTRAFWIY